MTKMKVPRRYLPSLNEIKDMQKQVKMLMKSTNFLLVKT